MFEQDDDTIIVLKNETISKMHFQQTAINFWIMAFTTMHLQTSKRYWNVLDTFWMRVVSSSQVFFSFSFFGLKGLPSFKPPSSILCNSQNHHGVLENWINWRTCFFSEWLPKCCYQSMTSVFFCLDPPTFHGGAHHPSSFRSPGRRIHDANLFFHFFPLVSHRISIPKGAGRDLKGCWCLVAWCVLKCLFHWELGETLWFVKVELKQYWCCHV